MPLVFSFTWQTLHNPRPIHPSGFIQWQRNNEATPQLADGPRWRAPRRRRRRWRQKIYFGSFEKKWFYTDVQRGIPVWNVPRLKWMNKYKSKQKLKWVFSFKVSWEQFLSYNVYWQRLMKVNCQCEHLHAVILSRIIHQLNHSLNLKSSFFSQNVTKTISWNYLITISVNSHCVLFFYLKKNNVWHCALHSITQWQNI